jgi:hypothetical protein
MRGVGIPLVVVALFAALAPSAQAARTWAGTWSTTAGGEMVLDATGSGTYSFGRGTIRGGVNGDVNRGTWDSGNGTGTFKFTLDHDGLTFAGEGRYDDTGISENAFAWNGTCIAGACLENDVGGGGGGSCSSRPLDLDFFAAARAGSCPRVVKFSFATRADELPDKPDKSQLPRGTVELQASSEDTKLEYDPGLDEYVASGTFRLDIADSDDDESFIKLDLGAEGEYVRNGDLRRVNFDGVVDQSSHPDCDESTGAFDGAFAVKKERANLRLVFRGGCLSEQTILWKKAKKFQRAWIKVGRG